MNKKIISFLSVACLVLFTAMGIFAYDIPQRDESYYVNDYADVISEDEKQQLLSINSELNEKTGAEIVVVTVDFIGGSIEDYSYQLFNQWKIGDAKTNNGLLLVMSIGDEDYYACMGSGLEKNLSVSRLDDYLYTYLEDDFAAERYGQGAVKFTKKIADYIMTLGYNSSSQTKPQNTTKSTNTGSALLGLGIVILVLLLIISMSKKGGSSTPPPRRGYRPAPPRPPRQRHTPPPPPRPVHTPPPPAPRPTHTPPPPRVDTDDHSSRSSNTGSTTSGGLSSLFGFGGIESSNSSHSSGSNSSSSSSSRSSFSSSSSSRSSSFRSSSRSSGFSKPSGGGSSRGTGAGRRK